MNRKDAAVVLTIPATIAGVPSKPPAPVTQAELQAVIDAQNHAEVLAADIRRRLEAGAELEHGTLGASSYGHPSLSEIGIGDAHQCDGFGILDIEPAKDIIRFRNETLREHPKLTGELAAEFASTMWT